MGRDFIGTSRQDHRLTSPLIAKNAGILFLPFIHNFETVTLDYLEMFGDYLGVELLTHSPNHLHSFINKAPVMIVTSSVLTFSMPR
jgi:hypothetical protein